MRFFLNITLLLLLHHLSAQNTSGTDRWQADINFLQQELPKAHPNLFQYYPQKAFESDLADLKAHLTGKSDLQIALELQCIVAKVRDAQTRLDLAPLLQQGNLIPVGYGWYSDGLYVSATVKKFAPALGKRVVEINGMAPEAVLEKMGRFYARENDEANRRDGPLWLRYPAAIRMAGVSQTDTLELIVADEKGQRYFLKTYPVDFRVDKAAMQPVQFTPKSPDLRWNPMKQVFSLEWLEADSIVYLQYNACLSSEMALANGDAQSAGQLPPFQPLADSIVALMDRHPGARFFFDLRFNLGGNPADGFALAERLGGMPFVNLPNRMYVALNRYSADAAVEIAAMFEKKTNASLIGEPPAQRPNHFGSAQSFFLPNSQIQVYYGARAVDILPNNPEKLRLNIPIELPFSAFREGKDPLLDFVRALVRH